MASPSRGHDSLAWQADPDNIRLAIARDRQPRHRTVLELADDLGKTCVPGLELAHAVASAAHHDRHADRHRRDQLESGPAHAVQLLVEVKSLPLTDK